MLFNDHFEPITHDAIDVTDELSDYYDYLSVHIMCFIEILSKKKFIFNFNTSIYYSISETLKSISSMLSQSRLGDAYALLRKYHDSTTINIYLSILINDNDLTEKTSSAKSFDDFYIPELEDWFQGKASKEFLDIRKITNVIRDTPSLSSINALLNKNLRYKKIRQRCNDSMHYNQYHNFILNTKRLVHLDRDKLYTTFKDDLISIFARHLAYIFILNKHYVTSSDYTDFLECNITPPEGCDRWIDCFSYKVFKKYVKPFFPAIAHEMMDKTNLDCSQCVDEEKSPDDRA